ncbi:hypothetical protein, partial [Streptomyces sp. NPDC058665]|uniref:hypothetical protein n=1 Tax=Streptomyces sp. NPDC058665 TaxID=3346586 RepID=UPI0036502B8A
MSDPLEMGNAKKKPVTFINTLPVSESIMDTVRKAIGAGALGQQASQNVWALNAGIGVASGASVLRAAGAYRSPLADFEVPGVIAFKQDLFASVVGVASGASVLRAAGAYRSPLADFEVPGVIAFKQDLFASVVGVASG